MIEKNAATGLARWTLRGPDNQVLRTVERQPSGQWSVLRDNLFACRWLLAAHSPAGLHHFHLDHLGSVRLETDAAGNPIKYRDFLPFGESLDTPGGTENRLLYTGHQRDDRATPTTVDDLDYMHARYCSPTFGRFLSVDPVLGRTASPQSWNRYAYVRGNPVKLVDPDGREPVTIGLLLLGAIEVGFTIYDVYDTYVTVTDPQESGFNKLLSGGGLAAGIFLPAGAYGKTAKVLMARAEKVPGVARVVRNSGDVVSLVNPKIYAQLERQLEKDGVQSVLKALRSAEQTLVGHKAKLDGLEHKSKVEATIRNVESQIATLRKFIEDKGIGQIE